MVDTAERTEAAPTYRTLNDYDDRMTVIRSELARLDGLDDPSSEDVEYQGSLIEEYNQIESRATPLRQRMDRISAIVAAGKQPQNTEHAAPEKKIDGAPELGVRRSMLDPLADMDRVRANLISGKEMRERSLTLIENTARRHHFESDEHAEVATRRAERSSAVAKHILSTGSEEYRDAFRDYLADPETNRQRAALTLTLANGGYLLPYVLDPTIILTNAGSANPWRRVSRIEQTTSNTWNGVTSAGVTAQWLGEATIVTDASPTVGNVVVTPQKAAAWIFGSYEVLEDTNFGEQLPRLLADAKDRLEEAAFATGAGSGGVPQGVVIGATTQVTTGTTLVYAIGDVYKTHSALPARFRNSQTAAWGMNVAYIDKTRQFDTAGGSSFWTNLGKGQPETLLGAPIYESTTMFGATQAVGSLIAIYGDFSQYIIVDRVGVSVIYDPLVQGTAGILPSGQAGWFMFWRVGAVVAVPNAFVVLKGL